MAFASAPIVERLAAACASNCAPCTSPRAPNGDKDPLESGGRPASPSGGVCGGVGEVVPGHRQHAQRRHPELLTFGYAVAAPKGYRGRGCEL